MNDDLPWDDIDPLHQRAVRHLDPTPTAEKPCGCHPNMPTVRTPAGWACLGCGWGHGNAA